MLTRRRLLVLGLALLGLLLVGGAVSLFTGAGSGPSTDDALATLRTRSTPVLYLGESFAGARLTRVREDGARVIFDYDGRVQVQQGPLAGNNPVRYLRVSGAPLPCGAGRVRGVPAAQFDGLEVYTGRSTVSLFARTRAERLRMAAALRRVDQAAPAGPLPPPAIDLERGLRACRARL